MVDFESRYGTWVVRFRWWIAIVSLAAAFGIGSGAQHLRFTNDYRIFFSADNPQRLAFEELENTYTKNDNVMFVIAPKSGDAFDAETLSAVEWMTDEAWQTPFSSPDW